MRILIDAVAASAGGAGLTRVRELARWFPVLGPHHEYMFVVRPELTGQVRSLAPAVRVWSPPWLLRRPPMRLAWEHSALPLGSRPFQPEVVFSPFNIAPMVWPAPKPRTAVLLANLAPYSEALLARCRRRELVRNRALKVLTTRALKHADRVFVVSRQAFDLVPVLDLEKKAVVIPHSPPPAPSDDASAVAVPSEPYVIVVADLYKWKGVETVIDAVALLRHKPALQLLVCGRRMESDYAKALVHQAERLGIADRVHLLGSVRYDDMLVLTRHAAACVASSRFENMSRVPIEAMSVGTPVIACDIAAYRELCGDTALYYPEDSAAQLAEQLVNLIVDDSLANRMRRRGVAHIADLDSTTGPKLMLRELEALANGS